MMSRFLRGPATMAAGGLTNYMGEGGVLAALMTRRLARALTAAVTWETRSLLAMERLQVWSFVGRLKPKIARTKGRRAPLLLPSPFVSDSTFQHISDSFGERKKNAFSSSSSNCYYIYHKPSRPPVNGGGLNPYAYRTNPPPRSPSLQLRSRLVLASAPKPLRQSQPPSQNPHAERL